MNGSDENGNASGNGNGRGKTLLPEFLPAPRATEAQTPPERVAERARILLQRFRGLGAAASAALFSLHCNNGYMVVDPLPPPPVSCTTVPDPFASLIASGMWGPAGVGTSPDAILVLQTPVFSPGNLIGFSIGAVTVSNGTLIEAEDLSNPNQVGGGTRFHITFTPAAAGGTTFVDVALICSPKTSTKHYSIAYRFPGDTLVVMETPPADAGTD